MIALTIGRLGPFIELDGRIFRTSDGLGTRVLIGALVVNAALAVFNMLPIPPLDGSRLLPLFLGPGGRRLYDQASRYGFIVLILLLFVFSGSLSFLGSLIDWVIRMAV
jgi:Zn-dependent protease